MMKQIIFLSITTAVLFACGGKANTPKIKAAEEAIPVKLIALHSQSVPTTLVASGLLATEEAASLSFKIGGVIENILVAEGQQVRKGQLLATLKPTEITAQVQQVQLSVDKARRDYQRARNLYNDSVATLEQLQNAQTGLELAEQQHRQVAFNRQYANIYAPADGFIVNRLGAVGELAGPGMPVLMMNAVSGSSRWVLKVGLPDKEWALVERGDSAEIQLDAFPGKLFRAVVSRKALAANPANGAFEILLQPDLQGLQPGAGMFGKAKIHTRKQQSAAAVPYEALLEANGRAGFVFVSNDKRTVKRVPVQIGAIEADKVLITGGLEVYSFLVTSGSPYLADGGRIKAAP